MSSSSQSLPPKEATLFKRVMKCYEQKQYKAGLKYAKQILSNPKFAEHGETLAMKGLTLNSLGRKDDAYEDARRGLKSDLKSHICWHVYGLLQRSDRKYDEAIKCYRNALKLDKDNVQILRDLGLLQIQMRDLEGYRETQSRLLQLRSGTKHYWLGYCVAHDLLDERDMAVQVLREYRRTQSNLSDYEQSELVMYENLMMRNGAQSKLALEQLKKHRSSVRDLLSYDETKVELMMSEERFEEASEVLATLIDRNPEKWTYYAQLEHCLKFESEEDRLAMYTTVLADQPRAMAPKRLPLEFTTGDRFRGLLDTFLLNGLRKGIPQLFNSLKSLYTQQEKVDTIQEMCLGLVDSLKKNGKCHAEDEKSEPPSTYLWLLFFLAQHYDKLGKYQVALEHIAEAIAHTPTLIELYMMKAKIYKHAGDMKRAAHFMDEARDMDTADRYVNCKAAKYLLRVNNVERAEELCAMFTREGASASQTLTIMQCMWYLTESAQAYMRRGQWGEALKKCHEIDRHFDEFVEDQFDFHTYCLRRGTPRTYCKMLAIEDKIRNHHFFGRAAKTAIECYLHLADHPVKDKEEQKVELSADMDSKERKKELSKQRKAAKRRAIQQQEEEERKKAEKASQQQKVDKDDAEDSSFQKERLDPAQLAKAEKPLEQADKFLKPLLTFQQEDAATHFLAFQVYAKKRKVLPMLKALKSLARLAPEHPQYHAYLCEYALTVQSRKSELPEPVFQVAQRGLEELMPSRDVQSVNSEFLKAHGNSQRHLLAGARTMFNIDQSQRASCIKMVTNMDASLTGTSLEACRDICVALDSGVFGDCQAELATYKAKCHELYPMATVFLSSEELQQVTEQLHKLSLGGKPVVNGHAEEAS